MSRKINLKESELFEIANKLALAYATAFTADTISRATTYVEGSKNPSRNYVWGILINTQGKTGKLHEVYTKATASSLVKLTIYKLAQPSVSSKTVDF